MGVKGGGGGGGGGAGHACECSWNETGLCSLG